jgi:hypothetical protein
MTEPTVEHLAAELAGARATIDHMSKAMSWICGHDRQGLDHLDEAMRESRAREAAVKQARTWAARARTAEAALDRVRQLCELTIDASIRVDAVHQAHDTLTALDQPTKD